MGDNGTEILYLRSAILSYRPITVEREGFEPPT